MTCCKGLILFKFRPKNPCLGENVDLFTFFVYKYYEITSFGRYFGR